MNEFLSLLLVSSYAVHGALSNVLSQTFPVAEINSTDPSRSPVNDTKFHKSVFCPHPEVQAKVELNTVALFHTAPAFNTRVIIHCFGTLPLYYRLCEQT